MQTLFIIPGACSFGSMVTLEWLNKPYQIGLTTPEIRASDTFRRINPLGKVGALKDGDNLVYENLAILLYLVDKNPNSCVALALNSRERIEAYKWLSYLASTLQETFVPLFYPTRFVDETTVPLFQQNMTNRLKGLLSHINTHLDTNKYFITHKPTVVDAQAYGLLRWAVELDLMAEYPHIQAFLERMNKLPAVQNALNIEQQKIDALVNSSFAGYYNFA